MDATKTLSFTSSEYHMLKLAARGEGKKPEEFLASLLTRFFRAMADLQGIECPVTVTPEHIHRPGLTHTAAVLPTQHTAATIPGEEVHPDGSLRLDALTGSEPEPAAPAADFFADLD